VPDETEYKKAPGGAVDHLKEYSSVSVVCDEMRCLAAKKIMGKRFFRDEVPGLPLPKCSSASCNCKYISHGDRRSFLTNRRYSNRLVAKPDKRIMHRNRRTCGERRKLKIHF
jgi:hypothetical protein